MGTWHLQLCSLRVSLPVGTGHRATERGAGGLDGGREGRHFLPKPLLTSPHPTAWGSLFSLQEELVSETVGLDGEQERCWRRSHEDDHVIWEASPL